MGDSGYEEPYCLKNPVYIRTHPCYGDLYDYQDCVNKNSQYNCKDFKPTIIVKIKDCFKK